MAAVSSTPSRSVDLRPPPLPPQLVAKAIEHRLPQIGLERADAARLEVLDSLKRLKQRVLDKVVGVGEIARPFRQPPAGPSLQRLKVPREQALERLVSRWLPVDRSNVESSSRPG